MVELTGDDDVVAACEDDPLLVWAAQGMRAGVRAWALGEAVAVASPDLNRRDRLTVRGDAREVTRLVRLVLPELGPSYRLLGDRPLVEELAGRMGEVEPPKTFEWMDTDRPPPVSADREGAVVAAGWLRGADGEVGTLLAQASPSSWAVPGLPWIRRWAGLRESGGQLVATAADAWSCPRMGFVAGVATAAAARGRGYGQAVCRFVFAALAAEHGRVALMVDTDNRAAIGVYGRLGMKVRPVAAAVVSR
ncbi:GNAT superfamily N-acetyltransferase [Streptosporangium album]|uniref:GNAT superfamily N-acetyltransferase n=1 Tax=Streptosporangium album TaxID=47479 RepID=A0A7W7S4H5_9ACTN|nr:GNAT family N-acetyltransferase [Streptosporangium album]MBB4943517.1 GNAT superfamily N-acetyltransferase [Streptosporangium album]